VVSASSHEGQEIEGGAPMDPRRGCCEAVAERREARPFSKGGSPFFAHSQRWLPIISLSVEERTKDNIADTNVYEP